MTKGSPALARAVRCLISLAIVTSTIVTSTMVTTAWADVGFLFPNTFHADERGRITAIASFSDGFPSVEHPLRSDDFHIVLPDGTRQDFSNVLSLDQLTALSVTLDAPGVYRLSSGNRLGRKGQASMLDGKLVRLGADGMDANLLPGGAPRLTSQTATVSEVYVRKGEVELPSVLETSGRLQLRVEPVGDGDYVQGSALRVTALFDGKPLTDRAVTLHSAFDTYTEEKEGVSRSTHESGAAVFTPQRAGPHVIFVRHMARAPEGSETDIRSYTTSLVFEVLP